MSRSSSLIGSYIVSIYLLFKLLNIKIHKSIILYVVVYGCQTWSLILKEERDEELHTL